MLENKAIKQVYNSNYKFPTYKDGDKLIFIKVDYVAADGKKHTQTSILIKISRWLLQSKRTKF